MLRGDEGARCVGEREAEAAAGSGRSWKWLAGCATSSSCPIELANSSSTLSASGRAPPVSLSRSLCARLRAGAGCERTFAFVYEKRVRSGLGCRRRETAHDDAHVIANNLSHFHYKKPVGIISLEDYTTYNVVYR